MNRTSFMTLAEKAKTQAIMNAVCAANKMVASENQNLASWGRLEQGFQPLIIQWRDDEQFQYGIPLERCWHVYSNFLVSELNHAHNIRNILNSNEL